MQQSCRYNNRNNNGAAARFVPALIVWALAAVGFVLLKVFRLPLSEVGFAKPQKGTLKRLWYLITLIAVALSAVLTCRRESSIYSLAFCMWRR